jgi:hypothetical protein
MRNLKYLLLSLLLWSTPCFAENTIGPTNLIQCNKSASVTVAVAGTAQAIAGVAGQTIHLCGWQVTSSIAGAVTQFQFESGTGATCTTPTTFTPALNISSNAPSVDRTPNAWISMPTAAFVCIVTTGGSVGTTAILYFAQF